MARNRNQFSFSMTPTVSRARSRFDLSHTHKTTGNVGDMIPFLCQEVYPGDTFKVDTNFVARTTTPFLKPVMDNLFADMYYFFVPSRLVWDNWEVLMGENKGGYWAESDPSPVPQFSIEGEVSPQSLANYLALPVGLNGPDEMGGISISDLPFRAFAMIWNDWFRDQNTQAPVNIDLSDNSYFLVPDDPSTYEWSPTMYHGNVPKINKVHDYFTSCLPAPQKGDPVELPLTGDAPVVTGLAHLDNLTNTNQTVSLCFSPTSSGNLPASDRLLGLEYTQFSGQVPGYLSRAVSGTTGTEATTVVPNNLWADMSNVNSATVNDLRFAFQLQKMLEQDARGGTRYTELLQSHFGVRSPDARLQRPEYLGGSRNPISIQQVTQTTGSDSNTSPLAQVGAFSLSGGSAKFTKGFVEHGFVIGICAVRYFHTYQQGIERFWTRKNRTDFYMPVFANIGEQPVYQSELYSRAEAGAVFGYNEAWADLRYRPNRVSGYLQSGANGSLDIWHFADNYANAPVISDAFLKETSAFVDRTLSVPSETAPNFIFDFYIKNDAIRVLPTYSFPGLIDHH